MVGVLVGVLIGYIYNWATDRGVLIGRSDSSINRASTIVLWCTMDRSTAICLWTGGACYVVLCCVTLYGFTRHGPYVGPSVSLDLSDIGETPHGEAVQGAVQGGGDRFGDAGFACTKEGGKGA